jgi:Kef-type K+ transport system membrane component KefB
MGEWLAFPVSDPVLTFSVILFMVLLATVTLRRFGIPSVVGLILLGIALGPYGSGVLERDMAIVLFGTVGLLYIMFMAALEIDIADLKKNSHKSALFALFSFGIPMGLGMVVGHYLLGLSWGSAALLGSMFGSHTLLAFPAAQQLGIAKNRAIAVAVGGSVLTDTAALIVLAIVAALATGVSGGAFWGLFALKVAIFGVAVFWLVPIVAQWFFKVHEESVPQYIFVLAIAFLVAYGAQLAGLEPIIGAFFAGLALNRFIPAASPLMNRVGFIGNAIFIPFFLIGVGMMVDPLVFISSGETVLAAALMTATVIVGKLLGTLVTSLSFKQSRLEFASVFGLTIPQAAATLAVAFVGMELGLFGEVILNGAVMMILFTCLAGSLIVEKAGAKLAEKEAQVVPERDGIQQKILIAIEKSDDIDPLVDLAVMLKDPDNEEPIYALNVIREGAKAEDQLILSQRMMEEAVKLGSATESQMEVIARIAPSVALGIARGAREVQASDSLIVWDGDPDEKADRLYGDVIDTIIKRNLHGIWVTHLKQPLNTFKRITLLIPPRSELEEGYFHTLHQIKRLIKETGAKTRLAGSTLSLRYAKAVMMGTEPPIESETARFDDWRHLGEFVGECTPDDLLIILSSRKETLSYAPVMDEIPDVLMGRCKELSAMVIYPRQLTLEQLKNDIRADRYKELFGGSKRRIRELLKAKP